MTKNAIMTVLRNFAEQVSLSTTLSLMPVAQKNTSPESEPRGTYLSKVFNLSQLNKSLAEKSAWAPKRSILEPNSKSCKKRLKNYNEIQWVEKTNKRLESTFLLKVNSRFGDLSNS